MKFSILSPFFLAINGAKEQRCNLAEILAEIFEENVDRKSEIQRLKRGYKIRPDKENNQKNAFSFRLKKKELINWKPENGAAVGFIRCSFQPDLRTKIKCLPNGKAVLEGTIHKCERGCDISKLGLFSENADNSCQKTEAGIEAQGSRCKRRCVLNSTIETARPIICECNGKFCKYTVGHEGKNLPFNPEPLEKLCREHKIGKNLRILNIIYLIFLKMAERSEKHEAKICVKIFRILILVAKLRFAHFASLSHFKKNKSGQIIGHLIRPG